MKRQPIYAGIAGKLARAVDRTVSILAPQLVHRMQKARVKSAALLAFEAARVSRVNGPERSVSADGDILPDLKTLRDLSRALIRDDAHASSAADIHAENIVGTGITPQPACTPASTGLTEKQCDEWNAACLAEWERWSDEEADATGTGSFYDLQELVVRCWVSDGETLSHAVMGGDGMLACELIDVDRLESPNHVDTDTMRGGVELDAHGRAVAYHVMRGHPDDSLFGYNASRETVRLAAESGEYSMVQHVFRRRRAGQTRGVPWTAASLLYARHLHHYLDSELIAARAASNYAMFIRRPLSETDQDVFPVQDNEQATGQTYYQELNAGTIEYLNEGEEPVAFSPNRPGAQFDTFVTRVLRAFCSSLGLAYEMVAKDFGRMNLSSSRTLLREVRRGFDQARSKLNRQFNRPWYRNVIRAAVNSGRLVPPSPRWVDNDRPFLACRWVAPAYGIVDPVADAAGSDAAIAANISTPQIEASRQGLHWLEVLRERGAFLREAAKIEQEMGLKGGALTRKPNEPSPPADGGADDDDDPPDDDADTKDEPTDDDATDDSDADKAAAGAEDE
jgi:lambda family phage portal protein